ncbi:hypothetical protein G6F65_021023 [Rhizopus arrhizus]|nr:hypothetical protein G6F65_021023 [Rhizopus arrhizus]
MPFAASKPGWAVAPRFDDIDAEVAAVKDLRDKPVGTIRITSAEHAATSVLWPKLSKVMRDYPDINVEISIDYTMADIVSQRFDAGPGPAHGGGGLARVLRRTVHTPLAPGPDSTRLHPAATSDAWRLPSLGS